MKHNVVRAALFASVANVAMASPAAHAQDAPDPATQQAERPAADPAVNDIIVTARRRDETSIAVPVAITAIGGEDLERRAINSFDAIAAAVPSLVTSEASSSVQGGIIAIRGLAGADGNPLGDQAVSFNVDSVPVARSSVRRLAQMDIAQVEILKGPQALFFGKNSPAGIISMRTGDPTASFQGRISAGYEFEADEIRTDAFIAGPLTDTLGFRVAGYFSDMEGYVRNVAPTSGAGIFPSERTRVPYGTEYAVRGTLKWEPSDAFDARLKVSYNNIEGSATSANLQQVNCPLPVPQTSAAPENCVADDKVTTTLNIGPAFGQRDARFGNGETFGRFEQLLAGLEMNFRLSDSITLSSITGHYWAFNNYLSNFTANFQETGVIPRVFLPAYSLLDIEETTQELRLTSDFGGPVNFMFGGLYQQSTAYHEGLVYFNALRPTYSANYVYEQEGESYSVFGQTLVKFIPELELSVGARASFENKALPVYQSAGPAGSATPTVLRNVETQRQVSFNNLSPEVSLSYRPTTALTIYGAYKEGFLSGGFNATQPTTTGTTNAAGSFTSLIDITYGQQLTRGFEGGIKTSLLGGALRANLSAYSYVTSGLQVVVLVGLQQELRNAGKVGTKGVEFDFNYRTPIDGLTINGAVNYNDGTYLDYQGSCYRGLPAPQCRQQINRQTGTLALLNDLSGTQLVRSPEWTGNIGFFYEQPITSGLKIGLSGDFSHSDSYFTDVVSAPGGIQDAYQLYDAAISLSDIDDRWDLSLVGRNLGNEFYISRSADTPFTGSAPGGAGTILGDTTAVPSRGREVMLRATFRFGG